VDRKKIYNLGYNKGNFSAGLRSESEGDNMGVGVKYKFAKAALLT
jgi:hypothetical protein